MDGMQFSLLSLSISIGVLLAWVIYALIKVESCQSSLDEIKKEIKKMKEGTTK